MSKIKRSQEDSLNLFCEETLSPKTWDKIYWDAYLYQTFGTLLVPDVCKTPSFRMPEFYKEPTLACTTGNASEVNKET